MAQPRALSTRRPARVHCTTLSSRAFYIFQVWEWALPLAHRRFRRGSTLDEASGRFRPSGRQSSLAKPADLLPQKGLNLLSPLHGLVESVLVGDIDQRAAAVEHRQGRKIRGLFPGLEQAAKRSLDQF